MQRKLNDAFLADYCTRFCEEISSSYYETSEVIDGKTILSITPSKQVNFFILKTLFTSWQEEMKRLESPYFNFKDLEVRNAMVSFMNLLSQKIEIRQPDFDLLLRHAVDQTIRILVDPAGFTVREFEQRGLEHLSEKTLKTFFKYVKVHKEEFEEVLEGIDGISLDELSELLTEYFSELDPEEELRNHLDVLSRVSKITAEDLFEAEETFETEDKFEPDLEEVDMGALVIRETIDAADEYLDDKEEDQEAERFLANQEISETGASGEPVYNSEEAESEIDNTDGLEEEIEEADELDEITHLKNIHPDAEPTTKVLNDRFEEKNVATVSEKLQQTKIASIMEAITVNNRYLFTKVLFEGNKEAFETAVDQIEQCGSFDEAVEMIVHEHAKSRDWDMNSDEVKELLKVVFRRFR